MDELPQQYRDFIYSGFATEAAITLGSAENFSPEQIKIFESSILLYLLFFIDKNDIVEILVNEKVPEKAAAGLVFALESGLPDFAKQSNADLSDTKDAIGLASEISAAEHDLASLQTVRTMSHDMAAIKPGSDVVYQSSSQADILRTPDMGELPNVASATPTASRWDTDTRQ